MKKLVRFIGAALLGLSIVAAPVGVGLTCAALSGCTSPTLQPGADPVVVYSEQTAKIAWALADEFVLWELHNRPTLPPGVTKVADDIRKNFPEAFWSFRKLTQTYKQNRTPEAKANLDTARAVLDRLVIIMRTYLPSDIQKKADAEAPAVRLTNKP